MWSFHGHESVKLKMVIAGKPSPAAFGCMLTKNIPHAQVWSKGTFYRSPPMTWDDLENIDGLTI